jgi:hypothetical protein
VTRRRPLLVLAIGLVAVWMALGSAVAGRSGSMRLDSRQGRVAKAGALSLPYPSGWRATSVDGTDVVVASFPVTREWLVAERRSLPEHAVYIQVFAYGHLADASDTGFPPRPDRLELDPETFGFYECSLRLEGYVLRLRDHGRAVQVEVALGRHADVGAALAVINRLRVA